MEDIYTGFIEKLLDNYKSYTITYKGKAISLNDFYSSSHWHKRSSIKKKFKPLLRELISKEIGSDFLEEWALIIEYNSRHDPDNVTGMSKLLVDALRPDSNRYKDESWFKGSAWVADDSKKFWKFFSIKPNLNLDMDTFIFTLIKLK